MCSLYKALPSLSYRALSQTPICTSLSHFVLHYPIAFSKLTRLLSHLSLMLTLLIVDAHSLLNSMLTSPLFFLSSLQASAQTLPLRQSPQSIEFCVIVLPSEQQQNSHETIRLPPQQHIPQAVRLAVFIMAHRWAHLYHRTACQPHNQRPVHSTRCLLQIQSMLLGLPPHWPTHQWARTDL